MIKKYTNKFFTESPSHKLDKDQLFTLSKITKCLTQLYEKLSKFHQQAQFPISEKDQESFNELVYLYLELFHHLDPLIKLHENKPVAEKFIFQLCKTLKILGLIFLDIKDKKEEDLPENFWLLSYSLFNTAEIFKLQNISITVNPLTTIDSDVISIGLLFKQLLIFQLFNTQHLSDEDKKNLFSALSKVSQYINIKESLGIDQKNKIVIKFCLEKDTPPSRLEYRTAPPLKSLRYLDLNEAIKVIKILLNEIEKTQDHPIDRDLCAYLIKSLEQKKAKRRYTRIKTNHNCAAVLGLNNVLQFLLDQEGKKQHQYDWKETFAKNTRNSKGAAEMVLERQSHNSHVNQNLKIIDNSINGYSILWNNVKETDLQVGDIIGVLPNSTSKSYHLEIAIIRRISTNHEGIIFGVEIIGSRATLIYVERKNESAVGEWVIFLFGSPYCEMSVLTRNEKQYKVNELIFVQLADRKAPCRLGDVVNANELITQLLLKP